MLPPLIKDVDAQWRRGQVLFGLLGLNWEDIKGIASGPAAVALLRPAPERVALVAAIDCTGTGRQRNAIVAKIARNVLLNKGKSWQQTVLKQPVTMFSVPAPGGSKSITICVYTRENLLILADDVAAVEAILSRWDRGHDSLLDVPAFREVSKRLGSAGGKAAHLSWYVDLEATVKAGRLLNPPAKTAQTDAITVLSEEGFSGVKALGGVARFGDAPFDQLSRIAILAPPPFVRAAAMLNFPNRPLDGPPPWVPSDVSRCLTFHWDMRDLITSAGFLVDRQTGKPGDFVAVVDALRDDKEGPLVDIREAIAQLTGRVTLVGDSDCPADVPDRGGRSLLAFEAKDEKVLTNAVSQLLAGEKGVSVRKFQGRSYWEIAKREITFPKDSTIEQPTLVVAVAGNRLMIGTHSSLLEKVLAGNAAPLVKQPDYLAMEAELKKLVSGPISFQFFGRPAQGLRGTYSLAQSGRLERGRTLSARLLHEGLASAAVKLDAGKMPPYEKVPQHLQPIGAAVTTRSDGWDIVGFSLNASHNRFGQGR